MDRAGPLDRGPERLAAWLTWALTCASVALLAIFVSARQGNLAWDDADYLRRGLTDARLATNGHAALVIPRALDRLLQEQPKPPLLVGWITLCALDRGQGEPRCAHSPQQRRAFLAFADHRGVSSRGDRAVHGPG